jgi:hypothetical protein
MIVVALTLTRMNASEEVNAAGANRHPRISAGPSPRDEDGDDDGRSHRVAREQHVQRSDGEHDDEGPQRVGHRCNLTHSTHASHGRAPLEQDQPSDSPATINITAAPLHLLRIFPRQHAKPGETSRRRRRPHGLDWKRREQPEHDDRRENEERAPFRGRSGRDRAVRSRIASR